jgi:glutamate-1-semialdehyde 2,1-aminomutase
VTQVGARGEFQFCAPPPKNGSEADTILDAELEQLIHLALLNRGVMISEFHNMLLACPDATANDVNVLLTAFYEVLGLLVST